MRSLARVESGNLKGALEDAKMVLDRDPNNQVARSIYDYASRSMDGGNAKGQKPNFAVMLEDGLKGPDPSRLTGQGSHQGHELFKGGLRSMTLSQTLAASARHKMELGDLKGALLAASQAIGADPQNTQAYSSRAAILNKMGNYEGAKLDATRAIALDPKSTNALNERSWAHNQLKQFLPALQDADASLAIDAAQAVAHLNKAIALEGLGKYKEALEAFKAASDLDPALMAFYEDAVDKYGAQVGWTDRPKKKVSRILRQRLGPLGSALPLAGLGALGLVLAYALFKALRRVNDEPMPGQGTNGHAKTMVMPQAQVRPSDVATIAATTLAGPPSSTPTIATPSSNTAGRLIAGNFQIIRELGRGGMGVVYEGKDITLARTVAIKQMRPEIRQSSKETERFLSEARLVASLKHPNLAEIYSILQDSGDLFLVFEYISGKGLDKLMDEKPRLSPKETNNILQDVSKALDYAHSKKIIHRDLKPSNIMVTEDNQAKVMDFGIAHQAKLTVSKLTSAGMWGTPAYMPPEQEMGLASKESDLYALAVMTYEMLTGEIPFAGPNFLHQKQRCMYKPASELVPELPKALDQFFQRALNPEPQERFHGGAELLHAFQKAL
ncbi:MAG: protein kinase [Elusimicrobia bacterium]|nr:protein kinase [Elusimicrobiota bacterium]